MLDVDTFKPPTNPYFTISYKTTILELKFWVHLIYLLFHQVFPLIILPQWLVFGYLEFWCTLYMQRFTRSQAHDHLGARPRSIYIKCTSNYQFPLHRFVSVSESSRFANQASLIVWRHKCLVARTNTKIQDKYWSTHDRLLQIELLTIRWS